MKEMEVGERSSEEAGAWIESRQEGSREDE